MVSKIGADIALLPFSTSTWAQTERGGIRYRDRYHPSGDSRCCHSTHVDTVSCVPLRRPVRGSTTSRHYPEACTVSRSCTPV